jgi:tetratricopeptide (TPR) repeat protein
VAGEIPGPHPQPLGVLPWPAGMLLLPDVPGAAAVAEGLVRGTVPHAWSEDLAFVGRSLDGDAEGAARLLDPSDATTPYNRAVLLGGDREWADLAAGSSGSLRALVDVGRFSVGVLDAPPTVAGIADDRGEVAALVHSARASAAIERGDPGDAVAELAEAVARATQAGSPQLAASLRLTRAEFLRERLGDPAAAARESDLALQSLPLTADPELRASLHVMRGLARADLVGDDRGGLLAVVADLTEATKTFRDSTHPEMFALCNHQLALAYLRMPMSDQGDRIRLGVAVQALRAALGVYTPEAHPGAWASVQVSLANALQYLPSAHQQANLEESVQIYEEVLATVPPGDEVSRARLLANQGNALGHLGVFGDARERLTLARALFEAVGDVESAAAVGDVLEGLAQAEAGAEPGSGAGRPSGEGADTSGARAGASEGVD